MRELIREYVLPGAVAFVAAAATALPLAWSIEREGDRIDDAVARTRRELEAVPEQVREEVVRFVYRKAELEHRIAVIEALSRSGTNLVEAADSVLTRAPEGAEWELLLATPSRVEMIFEAPHPLAAVRFAEEVAAAPELDLVDLKRASGEERPTERFYLSGHLVEGLDDEE